MPTDVNPCQLGLSTKTEVKIPNDVQVCKFIVEIMMKTIAFNLNNDCIHRNFRYFINIKALLLQIEHIFRFMLVSLKFCLQYVSQAFVHSA